MAGKLRRLVYRLGLRKRYKKVDAVRYLKRLAKGRHNDPDYVSDKDAAQFRIDSPVLLTSRCRQSAFRFFCYPNGHIDRQLLRDGLYAAELVHAIGDVLSERAGIFVDAGANAGAITIPLAAAFPACQFIAFEPNAATAARFRRNLAINALRNVTLHTVGLSDQPASMELYADDGGGGDLGTASFMDPGIRGETAFRKTSVEVVRLDDALAGEGGKVSVLKIDVQGWETQVLRGARAVIQRDRPVLFLEHEDINFEPARRAEAKRALSSVLAELRYETFYITRYSSRLMFPVDWERPLNGDLCALPRTEESRTPQAQVLRTIPGQE